MNDDACLIPRNLRKPDVIIHTPIKLTMKQLAYIGLGFGGAYITFSSGMPFLLKIIVMTSSVGVGVVGSFFKFQGSSLDELAADSLVYAQRKNYYHQLDKRGGMIVNINARKEEATTKDTKQIKFNIQRSRI